MSSTHEEGEFITNNNDEQDQQSTEQQQQQQQQQQQNPFTTHLTQSIQSFTQLVQSNTKLQLTNDDIQKFFETFVSLCQKLHTITTTSTDDVNQSQIIANYYTELITSQETVFSTIIGYYMDDDKHNQLFQQLLHSTQELLTTNTTSTSLLITTQVPIIQLIGHVFFNIYTLKRASLFIAPNLLYRSQIGRNSRQFVFHRSNLPQYLEPIATVLRGNTGLDIELPSKDDNFSILSNSIRFEAANDFFLQFIIKLSQQVLKKDQTDEEKQLAIDIFKYAIINCGLSKMLYWRLSCGILPGLDPDASELLCTIQSYLYAIKSIPNTKLLYHEALHMISMGFSQINFDLTDKAHADVNHSIRTYYHTTFKNNSQLTWVPETDWFRSNCKYYEKGYFDLYSDSVDRLDALQINKRFTTEDINDITFHYVNNNDNDSDALSIDNDFMDLELDDDYEINDDDNDINNDDDGFDDDNDEIESNPANDDNDDDDNDDDDINDENHNGNDGDDDDDNASYSMGDDFGLDIELDSGNDDDDTNNDDENNGEPVIQPKELLLAVGFAEVMIQYTIEMFIDDLLETGDEITTNTTINTQSTNDDDNVTYPILHLSTVFNPSSIHSKVATPTDNEVFEPYQHKIIPFSTPLHSTDPYFNSLNSLTTTIPRSTSTPNQSLINDFNTQYSIPPTLRRLVTTKHSETDPIITSFIELIEFVSKFLPKDSQ